MIERRLDENGADLPQESGKVGVACVVTRILFLAVKVIAPACHLVLQRAKDRRGCSLGDRLEERLCHLFRGIRWLIGCLIDCFL